MNSNNNDNQLNAMDFISMVNFFIGLANYGKNVDQNKMNRAIEFAVIDIHDHLNEQDRKIDSVIEMLKKGEQDGKS